MRNILTVDVEDWYHGFPPDYRIPQPRIGRLDAGMRFLLDALEEAHVQATFFWLGSQAALYPQLLRETVSRGHEIGSHGLDHSPIFKLTPAQFSEETRQSLSIISDITGKAVSCYRAPYFSINKKTIWALEILSAIGITHDSSILPMRHWRTGMPGVGDHIQLISTPNGLITEVPVTVRSFMGLKVPTCGGGYFRAYPYTLSSNNIGRCSKNEKPAVVYFHPWEFDAEHPHIKHHSITDAMHYLGLKSSRSKLLHLLKDHPFGGMMEIANETQTIADSSVYQKQNVFEPTHIHIEYS